MKKNSQSCIFEFLTLGQFSAEAKQQMNFFERASEKVRKSERVNERMRERQKRQRK